MSDGKKPPIIEGTEETTDRFAVAAESSGLLIVSGAESEKQTVESVETSAAVVQLERSDLYKKMLTQMPLILRLDVDNICNGDELLICEFSSILLDFGVLAVETVLNFRNIYQKPEASVSSKLGEIALIRGVIKLIWNFTEEMCVPGEKVMGLLKNISLTANCEDLRQLTDLMGEVTYLIQQGARCNCLLAALTISWNYMELLLFLGNYRCVMNLHGSVIAGEQLKAYLSSAQYGGVSRNFLN